MSSSNQRSTYVPTITLLMAIACIGVCAIHMMYATSIDPNSLCGKIIVLGQQGVPIFFVISGFVIPYSLWNSGYKIKNFFSYLLKRSIRIDPPYLLAIALTLVQLLVFGNEYFDLKRFFYHLLYLIPFTNEKWYQGTFWTLGIEFQFYIIIGLLFPFIKNGSKNIISLALISIAFTGHFIELPKQEALILSHIHCFCIGIVCLLSKKKKITLLETHAILIIITAYLCFRISYVTGIIPYPTTIAILQINFESAVSNFLGKISYSLYIFHLLIGGHVLLLLNGITISPYLLSGTLVISCIGFAYLFYLIIEVPALAWSERIKTKRTDLKPSLSPELNPKP